jgi:hypothetical protein
MRREWRGGAVSLIGAQHPGVRCGDTAARPLNPGVRARSASPGLVLPGLWSPTAGLVQHALFGQEQRLLQPAQGHSVQRLETAPAELPVGRVAGCLPGNHPPSYDPARVLDFKPGKAGGWSTAHSVPLTLAARSRGIAARLPQGSATRLRGGPGATGLLAGGRDLVSRSRNTGQWRRAAVVLGENIVLAAQPAQASWMNCTGTAAGGRSR